MVTALQGLPAPLQSPWVRPHCQGYRIPSQPSPTLSCGSAGASWCPPSLGSRSCQSRSPEGTCLLLWVCPGRPQVFDGAWDKQERISSQGQFSRTWGQAWEADDSGPPVLESLLSNEMKWTANAGANLMQESQEASRERVRIIYLHSLWSSNMAKTTLWW